MHADLRAGQSSLGSDPVNASAILPGANVELRLHFLRDVVRVLDHIALHIDQIERAVRTQFDADWPKCAVPAAEEFTRLLGGRAARDENWAVRLQDVPVNKVPNHVANQDAAWQIGRVSVPADEAHPAGGGEVAGLFRVIYARLRLGDRIDARHLAVIGNAARRLDRRKAGIAVQVADRDDALLEGIDVVGHEAPAPIIEHQAKAGAGVERRRKVAGLGIEAEIEIAQRHGRARLAR